MKLYKDFLKLDKNKNAGNAQDGGPDIDALEK